LTTAEIKPIVAAATSNLRVMVLSLSDGLRTIEF